jgi:predicted transport protein
MPLFTIIDKKLKLNKPINFKLEKDIQNLIESNIDIVFNCQFIASEFSTVNEHAGRIDSIALSEDNNPVILEYKKVESSELVNQSLYYLAWIKDHKGDFQIAVNKALSKKIDVDWSDIRVICIAPGYKKYDLYAVQMMGANIELWQYKLYENGSLYLEEVFRKNSAITSTDINEQNKNLIMVEAGEKAALARKNNVYTMDEHLKSLNSTVKKLFNDLRDFIISIDESIEESPKKFYIAYKVSQNFICVELKQNKITIYLKIDPKKIKLPINGRDVTDIGHYGTGNYELTITNEIELEESKEYIRKSFESIGG